MLAQLQVERATAARRAASPWARPRAPGRSPRAASGRPRAGRRSCRRRPAGRPGAAAPRPCSRRLALSTPRTSSPKAMFSHTGISGNSARFWKISAVGRWFGRMPRMSWPPIRTAPWVGLDEARDHAQDGRLAAARRAEEGEELAGLDRDVDIVDRPEGAEIHRYGVELDVFAHLALPAWAHASRQQQGAGQPAAGWPAPAHAAWNLSAYSLRRVRNSLVCSATTRACSARRRDRPPCRRRSPSGSARSIAPLATGLAGTPRRASPSPRAWR